MRPYTQRLRQTPSAVCLARLRQEALPQKAAPSAVTLSSFSPAFGYIFCHSGPEGGGVLNVIHSATLAWELSNQARSWSGKGGFRDVAGSLSLAAVGVPGLVFAVLRLLLLEAHPLWPCDLQVLGDPQLRR